MMTPNTEHMDICICMFRIAQKLHYTRILISKEKLLYDQQNMNWLNKQREHLALREAAQVQFNWRRLPSLGSGSSCRRDFLSFAGECLPVIQKIVQSQIHEMWLSFLIPECPKWMRWITKDRWSNKIKTLITWRQSASIEQQTMFED